MLNMHQLLASFRTPWEKTLRGTQKGMPKKKGRNILVMKSFLLKGGISLSSQHAYYFAPSSGFIKTRWNNLALCDSCGKIEIY